MTSAAALRFNRIAANFVSSEVHSNSDSIKQLLEILSLPPDAAVIDVACGAGHLALSFGGRARRIVGVDAAPAMLASFSSLAAQRGISVETACSLSHDLPFPSEIFDVAMSRLAPHHFPDLQASIEEMARVVRVGGFVAVIDLHGYEDAKLDGFNHVLEVLHDPTHVRSHTPSAWRNTLVGAGLDIVMFDAERRESAQGITVKRWCELADSGANAEREIRARLSRAAPVEREALGIIRLGDDYLIPVRTLLVVAQKRLAWSN